MRPRVFFLFVLVANTCGILQTGRDEALRQRDQEEIDGVGERRLCLTP